MKQHCERCGADEFTVHNPFCPVRIAAEKVFHEKFGEWPIYTEGDTPFFMQKTSKEELTDETRKAECQKRGLVPVIRKVPAA